MLHPPPAARTPVHETPTPTAAANPALDPKSHGGTIMWVVGDIDDYVAEVARRLAAALGDAVVGVYLHGSAAMGAFVPSRSDVDVLAVTRDTLAASVKKAVAEELSEVALRCPGVGLEMSIVTLESAQTPSDSPAFELHLNTQGHRVVNGDGHAGDPDLVAHFAMARTRGVALLGPPVKDV